MLKSFYIILLFAAIIISPDAYSQNNEPGRKLDIPTSQDDILLLDSSINLYQAGDFYISGQPTDSIISTLKEKGLGLIINVRTPEEMEKIKEDGFDEKAFSGSLHIPYVNIPMGGKYGFTQTSIKEINDAIQLHEGSVMIHCGSAGRATNAWMAWLINYYDTPIDDATSLGKQMQFRFYLEDLLGYELSFGVK
jgi:protein tyrosine phosphatase (PTP) superfamily phosphohydrolase (DUF442 family)